jgi:hypothetical protein
MPAPTGAGGAGGAGMPAMGPSGTAGAGAAPPKTPGPQGGILTAGSWDDNANFDFFLRYHGRHVQSQAPGFPTFGVSDRMAIVVRDADNMPVAGAQVQVSRVGEQMPLLTTTTGADGRVLFFPSWAGVPAAAKLSVSVMSMAGATQVEATAGMASVAVPLPGRGAPVRGLDLALVVDTTGSMGDEISYLQAELKTLVAGVREAFPAVDQRWALVAYKDVGDIYVTRVTDFVSSLDDFQKALDTLRAGGGGDYPEAPDRALADMNVMKWRDGAVARVAFWVADAPHHAKNTAAFVDALKGARTAGVHLYPVAASGADKLTEFSMRLGALVTGGRYLFLTDDSGVGGSHLEPTIPCYFVTSLQRAMLRMVLMELSGVRVDPVSTDVVRTGGNPQDGRCTLADGQSVSVL